MSEPPSTQSERMSIPQVRAVLAAARADVLGAVEKGKSLLQQEILELRRTLEEAVSAYESLLKETAAEGRGDLEHTLGRQVIDLRRLAAMVPQMSSGTAVKHSQDRQADGSQPFIETRPPPAWASPAQSVRAKVEKTGLRPGDEVDSWCGPCNGMRSHNIVAMVGQTPKQVICQACNGRHNYRTTPARTKSDKEDGPKQQTAVHKARKTPEQLQEERRQQELNRLRDELAKVPNVTPFDARRRYKSGEVIDHPEYGRGKIETALRSSIVVRFPSGRRSIFLQ